MLSPAAQRPTGTSRRARRVLARTKVDFWLDAAILVGFTVAFSFGFTGPAIHEWWGLALGLVLLVHLTLHWEWVVRTTRKLFARRGRDRAIWIVNLLLLVSMTLCVASGVLISTVALPALGLGVRPNGFWSSLHSQTADVTLLLVPVHAALRWRWIVSVARQILTRARVGSRR
jgi:uncharacterized protein DUF4405